MSDALPSPRVSAETERSRKRSLQRSRQECQCRSSERIHDQTRPRYPASTARPSRPTCAGRMRDATEHEQLGLPDLAGRAVSQWSDDRSVPARLSPAPAGQLLWTCVGVHPSSAMAPRKSAQRPPALHLFATHTDGRESRGGGGGSSRSPPLEGPRLVVAVGKPPPRRPSQGEPAGPARLTARTGIEPTRELDSQAGWRRQSAGPLPAPAVWHRTARGTPAGWRRLYSSEYRARHPEWAAGQGPYF